MNVDAAAERVYETIESYMRKSDDPELTDEEQKEILIGVLKVFIGEIVTLAIIGALEQTKIAVDDATAANLKERIGLSKSELSSTPPCRGEKE